MNRVIVLSAAPKLAQHVRRLLPQLEVIDICPEKSEDLKQLTSAKILIADCSLLVAHRDKLSSANKWIQSTSAGIEPLLVLKNDEQCDFIVTRFVDDVYGLDMSEYVVTQIVNHERRQFHEYECQRSGIWACDNSFASRRLICDMTIGILGLGNLGKAVAKTLKFFGATIWGLTRTPLVGKYDFLDKHVLIQELPDLLSNCDYIVSILPATPATDGLLNGEILKNCQAKRSIFMNIGRGNIVSESDLINALENQWISAAILDVFEVEPLPLTSKLWHMTQVTITPHNASCVRSEGLAKLFANNYVKYVKGETLPNIVDFTRGY